MLTNPNYQTNALRHAHVDQLQNDMETTLKQKTTREWCDLLDAAGVPAGPVNNVAAVTKDPQVAARNMVVSIADPKIGKLHVAGNPIKLSGVPEPKSHAAPPEIDADRAAILDLICQRLSRAGIE